MYVKSCQKICFLWANVELKYFKLATAVILLFATQHLPAQSPYKVYMIDEYGTTEKLHLSRFHKTDTASVIIGTLRNKGYFLANIDSIIFSDDAKTYKIYKGEKYKIAHVNWDNVPREMLFSLGVGELKEKKYSTTVIAKYIDKILIATQNAGYPFAVVSFDSVRLIDNNISVFLGFQAGQYITFDSMRVDGLDRTNKTFLSKYLQMPVGSAYNESSFRRMPKKLTEMEYLSLLATPEVDFVNEKAIIQVQVEEQKVNTFDGIVGFLQNPTDGKMTITGMVDLELNNMAGKGRALGVNWQQQRALSQTLDVGYSHPLFIGSKISFSADFNQIKQDTTFTNTNFLFGFGIPLKNTKASITYHRNSGRQFGSAMFDNVDGLADFNIDYYDFGVSYVTIKRSELLKKGVRSSTSMAVGDKKILTADSLHFAQGNRNSVQLRLQAHVTAQLPISKSVVLWSNFQAKALFNRQLFVNDLFRLGGLNSLRGFNELEFFASKYALMNTELRWFWAENSFVFTFIDTATIEKRILSEKKSDNSLGLGLGLSLNTNSGLFTLVYALGRQQGQEINFNQAKIHFGFSSRF